jgi:hypothetical protein
VRVFENGVLRRIFGPKTEEDGSWRKFHNDELHGTYDAYGGGERCLQGLVGMPDGKRPLGRSRRRW